MGAPSLTYRQLQALSPCREHFVRVAALMGGEDEWGDTPKTASQAREAGATFADILWTASNRSLTDPDVDRRLRLWMSDCAARVLHLFEREYPADARPRTAIVASRAYARGEINAAASAAARAAAWDVAAGAAAARDAAAWDAAARAAARGAAARGAAARDAARAAARAVAGVAARAAAGAAASAAADAAAWDAVAGVAARAGAAAARAAAGAAARDAAAGAAEAAWQFDRLIARLSDPEPEDIALPALAQAERRYA